MGWQERAVSASWTIATARRFLSGEAVVVVVEEEEEGEEMEKGEQKEELNGEGEEEEAQAGSTIPRWHTW